MKKIFMAAAIFSLAIFLTAGTAAAQEIQVGTIGGKWAYLLTESIVVESDTNFKCVVRLENNSNEKIFWQYKFFNKGREPYYILTTNLGNTHPAQPVFDIMLDASRTAARIYEYVNG